MGKEVIFTFCALLSQDYLWIPSIGFPAHFLLGSPVDDKADTMSLMAMSWPQFLQGTREQGDGSNFPWWLRCGCSLTLLCQSWPPTIIRLRKTIAPKAHDCLYMKDIEFPTPIPLVFTWKKTTWPQLAASEDGNESSSWKAICSMNM